MALRVGGVLLLFGFTFFITNTYPARIVGQYDFVRSFLLVVGSLCLLGTDQSILYFSGKLRSSNSIFSLLDVYRKMLRIIFFVSCIIFLGVLAVGERVLTPFFNDPQVFSLLLKASAILFFHSLTLLNTEVFRAINMNNVSEVLRNIIKYVPVIIAALVLPSMNLMERLPDCFLLGFILLGIGTTIMAFYYLRKMKNIGTAHTTSVKEIVITSYPIAVSSMAIFLLMAIDVMFLKKYFGDEVVAYYGVVIKLMTILSVIVLTINVTISTKIAELYTSQDHSQLLKVVRNGGKMIFLLTSPAAVLLCLFPSTILNLFGEGYASAREALIIVVIGQWICSFFGIVPIYLNMTGKQHMLQYILVTAVVFNFILNSILIPQYGMKGAAVSFSLSAIFWHFLGVLTMIRKDNINLFKKNESTSRN